MTKSTDCSISVWGDCSTLGLNEKGENGNEALPEVFRRETDLTGKESNGGEKCVRETLIRGFRFTELHVWRILNGKILTDERLSWDVFRSVWRSNSPAFIQLAVTHLPHPVDKHTCACSVVSSSARTHRRERLGDAMHAAVWFYYISSDPAQPNNFSRLSLEVSAHVHIQYMSDGKKKDVQTHQHPNMNEIKGLWSHEFSLALCCITWCFTAVLLLC